MTGTATVVQLTQHDVVEWASSKTARQINVRIDELITTITTSKNKELVEAAKFESVELVTVLRKRGVL